MIQDQVNSVQSQLHWEAPTWAGNGFKFQGAAVDFCGIRDYYSNDDYILWSFNIAMEDAHL